MAADNKTISVVFKAISDISDVDYNIKNIQKALQSLKLPDSLGTKFTKVFSELEKEVLKISEVMESGFQKKSDVNALESGYKKINNLMGQLQVNVSKISEADLNKSFQVDTAKTAKLAKQIEDIKKSIADGINPETFQKIAVAVKSMTDAGKGGKSISEFFKGIQTGEIEQSEAALKKLESTLAGLRTRYGDDAKSVQEYAAVIDVLRSSFEQITNVEASDLINRLQELQEELKNLESTERAEFLAGFKQTSETVNKTSREVRAFGDATVRAKTEVQELNAETERIKNSVKHFFSAANAVVLFRRAVRSALQTVKELDSAMTSIAVVSDFTIGDMWGKLPQFTKQANELGVTVKGAYESTTLFVQQGLNLVGSMALSNEVLKMARIAGLNAADATDAMTAALRGFNMELNETSGARITDVYSKLAAITAADTEEISTAMTKTASIAHAANMEFETTAAFLSQIIETTRESAETAGTALKTVIARFTEVKKLYESGEVEGVDEEGEIIDVNKVSAALRKVGISMKAFFAGDEGLDSIFLKLAEKWDGLDTITQRYIATMAAGSRQQSRFLAMMSNYGRTIELVDAANNSAGAGTEQFEKTLDSMETKLAKLKNAWDEFLMGLANNELIGMFIDLLTNIVSTVNTLTNALSGGNGLIKSLLTLSLTISSLRIGKSLFNKLFDKNLVNIGSKLFGTKKDIQEEAQKMGSSFISSFFKAIKDSKGLSGKDFLSNLFTTKDTEEVAEFITKTFHSELEEATKSMPDSDYIQAHIEDALRSDGFEAAAARAETYGITLDRTKAAVEKFGSSATINMNAVAAVSITTGAAFLGLSKAAEKLGAKDKVVKTLQGIGSALMATGTLLPIITKGAQLLGVSFTTAGVTIAKAGVVASIPWAWVIPIVIAVGVLTAGVIALNKAAQEKKLENRMKAAKEATDKAKKAAEDAKRAYDELLSSTEEYHELQNTLDGLVEGTKEWRDALAKVNALVLELLQTYPELARYLTVGSDGRLGIDDAGLKGLQEKKARGVTNTQAGSSMAVINEIVLSNEAAKEAVMRSIEDIKPKGFVFEASHFTGDENDWESLATEEVFEEIARLSKMSAEELESIFDNLADRGLQNVAGYIKSLIAEYAVYTGTLNENEEAIKGQARALLQATAAEELSAEKYANQLVDIFANKAASEASSGSRDSRVEDFAKRKTALDNEDFKALAEEYDVVLSSKDHVGNLERLYAAMTRIDVESIEEDLKGNAKALAAAIVDMEAGIKLIEGLDDFTTEIAGIDDGLKKRLLGLLAEDASLFDLGEIGSDFIKNLTEGIDVDSVAESLGMTGEELVATLENNAEQILKRQTQAIKGLTDKGIDESSLKGFSIEILERLSKQVADMGAEAAQDYVKAWTEVVSDSDLGAKQKEELENTLSDIDWSNMSDAISGMKAMTDMGMDPAKIRKFWDIATSGAKTHVKSVEEAITIVDNFHKKSVETSEAIDNLLEGKGTAEDLKLLRQANFDFAGSLVQTADGWQLVGSSAREATDALKEYNLEQLEMATQAQANRVREQVEFLKGMSSFDGSISMDDFKRTDPALIKSELGVDAGNYESEAEYWKAAEIALNEYINSIHEGQQSLELMQQEIDFQRSQTMSAKENEIYGGSKESIIGSAMREADELGMDNAELQAYAEHLQRTNELLEDNAARAMQVALANMKLNDGLGEIMDSYDDWTALIDETTGLIQASSSEDAQAFANLKSSINKMLNTTQDLSDDFWENAHNINLVKEAAEGSIDAIAELQVLATQNYLMHVELEEGQVRDQIIEFSDFITNFDFPDIEVGAELDSDKFIEEANRLIEAAGMTAEQVSAAFMTMGYDVQFDDNPQPTESTYYIPSTRYTISGSLTDPNNPLTMEPSIVDVKHTTKGTVAAPTIKTLTSTGSQGGGVSSKNRGKGAANKAKSTSKKSGKKGTKPKVWDNSYDKLYNLVEKTNEALRRREKIERDYDRLLKNRNMTASQLLANSLKQIANLREEIALQEQLRAGRLNQARNIGAETFRGKDDVEKTFSQWGVTQYASLDTATGRITIDWEGIEKITNVDKGGAVEAYISRLEEVRDQLTNIDKTIENAVDAIHEIKKQNQGDYLNFEQFVHDALVQLEQTFIDEARDLADTISSTNAKILNSLRESIQLERQIRDNTRTEEDIAEKEMRLAFLRRDTSAANALEIKQLEEEIISAREAYGDALIDQELDKLARLSENANEQRSRQIEIMQQQLEYNKSIGHFWGETYELLKNSINADDGSLKMDSSLMKLLEETEGFKGMSEMGQMKWIDEIVEKFALSQKGYASLKVEQAENRGKVVLGSGQSLTYDKKTGRWLDSEGGSYGDLNYDPVTGTYSASGYKAKPAPVPAPAPTPASTPAPTPSKSTTSSKPVLKRGSKGEAVKELQRKLGITADGSFGPETEKWVKAFQEIAGIAVDGSVGPATWKALENSSYLNKLKNQSSPKTSGGGSSPGTGLKMYKYAKGGLITHTGPAWLDGTKAEPESILSAVDTKNLIQLKDVLGEVLKGGLPKQTSRGDNYFEINIDVAELGSDYDVDQLIRKVKQEINDDARYRNVNAINILR